MHTIDLHPPIAPPLGGAGSGIASRPGMREALSRAIAAGEIDIVYQPVVATASGAVVGVEALARWRDPHWGAVPPDEFIPVAEETGLIHALSRDLLARACRQARVWTDEHPDRAPLRMNVNLSARQFARRELTSEIVAALDASGLAPEQLCLEITETAAMVDIASSIAILDGLRSIGCRVAIDDFGTGYSSLAYLSKLPIDAVKIDRSFVVGLDTQPIDAAIVGAAIALAWVMGIDAVAEGVERVEELSILTTLGCPLVQGFLLSHPLTAEDFERYWAENPVEAPAKRRQGLVGSIA